MFRSIVLLVVGLASLNAVPLFAEDAVLGQRYGSGVHAYFAGNAVKAFECLTTAIEGGSKDPRAFYFRGLAFLKLGREQDAKIDFQKGADLESRDVNKFYNVSKALERVQGTARMMLENYRVDARMAVLEENERARKARYEAIIHEESRVIREMAETPGAEATAEPVATPAAEPAAAPAAVPAAADPFAAPEEKPAASVPATPAAPAEDDPFATPEETPAAAPAVEAPAAAPAEAVPAEKQAAESTEDPFAEEPAAEAKVAADKTASEDPFAQ